MIVIDDYADGVIKIGMTKFDFIGLRDIQIEILGELKEYTKEGNAIYYCNDDMSEDFYIFNIEEDELVKYLLSRDCLNYLEAR